jgi:hypothetical protein
MDPRIRIRIHTKMSWIHDLVQHVSFFVQLDLLKLEDDVLSQPPAAAVPVVVVAAATAAPPLATDPWADFHQPKKSFYSSSDSDSGEN